MSPAQRAEGAEQTWNTQRAEMVRTQLQMRGIKSPAVLQRMAEVPRHRFVPESVRRHAYEDRALAIGHAATISQPYIVALMTELLDPKPWQKALEIGAGSGYQAAILAGMVRQVYSIEVVDELAQRARTTLKEMQYNNVVVRAGDGYKGWPEQAPFDRIIVTAAPPEIPEALIRQLAPGGRLVSPEGDSPHTQTLIIIDKLADGSVKRSTSIPVVFVPMVPRIP